MIRFALFPILLILLLLPAGNIAAGAEAPQSTIFNEPRTILALFDSRVEETSTQSRIHVMAEMPLNYLGLAVTYHDVATGLPDLKKFPDLRGIITWFSGPPFDDPLVYIDWIEAAMESGLRLVVLDDSGAENSRIGGAPIAIAYANRFFRWLGVEQNGGYSALTYQARVVRKDPWMVEFERPLAGVLPGFSIYLISDSRAQSYLSIQRADVNMTSQLVVTGPHGAFAADGYSYYFDSDLDRVRWRINPFEFFRRAYDTDGLPKPDVTTASGRRMYFSHIDGDGWRNLSEIEQYNKTQAISAEVILKEVAIPYPDLPLTVAPIVGDMDRNTRMDEVSRQVARAFFQLPHIEAGSHTWTHPFYWNYFANYSEAAEKTQTEKRAKEKGFFGRLLSNESAGMVGEAGGEAGAEGPPRAYRHIPYDIGREIAGAADFINKRLLPPGKRVTVVQWSGNTQPYKEVLAATREAGLLNINGGDTRLDEEYQSYGSVSAIGRQVENERQIYASNSNENTYTDLWTNRFFGFRKLIETVRNTEMPWRVKPFNVYYHMYSGEKLASLNALLDNLNYARTQKLAPVETSTYARIAEGFYPIRFVRLGERQWRIEDRKYLNTIRIDRGTFLTVDFTRSSGVIGQCHVLGALYVALDPAAAAPVLTLVESERGDREPVAALPYLVEARWLLNQLVRTPEGGIQVQAHGFGAGEMVWQFPRPGRFAISAEAAGRKLWSETRDSDEQGELSFSVPVPAVDSAVDHPDHTGFVTIRRSELAPNISP